MIVIVVVVVVVTNREIGTATHSEVEFKVLKESVSEGRDSATRHKYKGSKLIDRDRDE